MFSRRSGRSKNHSGRWDVDRSPNRIQHLVYSIAGRVKRDTFRDDEQRGTGKHFHPGGVWHCSRSEHQPGSAGIAGNPRGQHWLYVPDCYSAQCDSFLHWLYPNERHGAGGTASKPHLDYYHLDCIDHAGAMGFWVKFVI